MKIGYFLASEEHGPTELVDQADMATGAGFDALWISDHFHPWNDEHGQSPFVWSVIGGISQICDLEITTAVTCPTVRIHPVIIAQAAATSALMLEGRFRLGVGTGEALNEHVLGDRWPPADVRLNMLEEAVEVIRRLWHDTVVNHQGEYYTVADARLYSRPDEPPPIVMSGFGPAAIKLAARIGDGFVTTRNSSEDVSAYRAAGGIGPAQVGYKVCWAPTREEGVATAHRLWANSGVPGELAQVLPSPRHFEQVSSLVTPAMTAKSVVCGPDAQAHIDRLTDCFAAGFDEVYISQMGPDQQEFFDFYASEVLPEVRRGAPAGPQADVVDLTQVRSRPTNR